MANTEGFQAVFEQLKGILQPFAARLVVQDDEPGNYSLYTPYVAKFKKPVFVAAVQIKKNYVSYHLMPVYILPRLLNEISPELKRRLQGKSCFNFTAVNPATVDELARLTERGLEHFKHEFGL